MVNVFDDTGNKICKRCRSSDFGKTGRRCAQCLRDRAREFREANPTFRAKHDPVRYRAFMDRRYEIIKSHKDKPCCDCGRRFPPCAMDFDHVRGEKSFGIGAGTRATLGALLAEIAKCDVVCACCHRIRTWNRSHDWTNQV